MGNVHVWKWERETGAERGFYCAQRDCLSSARSKRRPRLVSFPLSFALMPFFEARGLSKKKPDGTWLFKDINISLNKGDIVALTGPSGVG